MANKVYRVIACIGRKRNVIFETKEFDTADGYADYFAFRKAFRTREDYCMKLWGDGFTIGTDGCFHNNQRNINAGRIDIVLCSK